MSKYYEDHDEDDYNQWRCARCNGKSSYQGCFYTDSKKGQTEPQWNCGVVNEFTEEHDARWSKKNEQEG